jgi:hypothetical protein
MTAFLTASAFCVAAFVAGVVLSAKVKALPAQLLASISAALKAKL